MSCKKYDNLKNYLKHKLIPLNIKVGIKSL